MHRKFKLKFMEDLPIPNVLCRRRQQPRVRCVRALEYGDLCTLIVNVCTGNSNGNPWRVRQHRKGCAGASKHFVSFTPTLMYAKEIRSKMDGGFDEMKQLASQVCIVYIPNLINMTDDGPRWLH